MTPPEGSIVVPDDFSTIQEAVDNAPEGGTVFVRSGNYSERVLVNKPLSLIGEDRESTVISVYLPGFLTYGAIEVSASDVTISGFTTKDVWIGILIRDSSTLECSRCKIIGNNIIDNFRWGVFLEPGENQNHIISGNYIAGNGADGIFVGSSNSVISGNNISSNGGEGIVIVECEDVTINNNNISSNGGGGLRLRWDGPFYIYGNNITDNQGYGIEFGEGCYDSIAYQNNIACNGIGVKLLNFGIYGSASIGLGNVVYRNNIVNNLQQVFVDPEWELAGKIEASGNGTDVVSWDNGEEGNYWSDYQTMYPDAAEVGTSGIGDTPYVIDENNTDQNPLMRPVDISSIPPPISEPSSDSLLTNAAIVVAVVVVILVGAFFVYRNRKKVS